MRNVVPRGLQWNCNEVLDVRCTSTEFCSPCGVQQGAAIYAAYAAEVPQPIQHIQPEFRNLCGIYGRVSAIYIMQQYILQKYTKFRLIHFGSVSNCRYRSIQTQVSFFQLSTIAALYKKAQGCAEGRGLVPLCGFLTFQCDLPSAGAAAYVPYSREPQSMRLYDRSSAAYAAYTAKVPQSMRPFGRASAAHAVIISPYKI